MIPPSTPSIPTLDDFLVAPAEQVAAAAPAALLLDLCGAPLATANNGDPDIERHARLLHGRVLAGIEALFRLGVRHIVTCVASAEIETGQPVDQCLPTRPEALATYARRGCRVRLVGAESMPELHTVAAHLAAMPADGAQTLWWSVVPGAGALWSVIAATAQRASNMTQAGFIRAFYGEDVPAATMLIGFGAPIAPGFISLLLAEEMQCYWLQRPVFAPDEPTLRRIFYDYAYVRPTRTDSDRSWRYTLLEQQRAAWETDAVLGVGRQLGRRWYPSPFPAAAIEGDPA